MPTTNTTRTRVKICGITRVDDAICAVNEGADALGLVFYEPSPRAISIESAIEIAAHVAPFVSLVGLFVNAQREQIESICSQVPLSLLQFHGDESAAECEGYNTPYIKAIRVQQRGDVVDAAVNYRQARGLLVDAYKSGVPGGTGETFDWDLLPDNLDVPLILAGGLNPENVRTAISRVKPFAVDVSGGVEQAKGVKDHAKITSFLREVARSQNEQTHY